MLDKNEIKKSGAKILETRDNLTQEYFDKLAKLKALIPEIVNSDNVLDMAALEDFINLDDTTANNKGYELTFAGKGLAKAKSEIPTELDLKVELSQSKNFDETENVIIRGDNIDALKILKQNYTNKIKMIYIDPPYNTKSENFVYSDNFVESESSLIEKFDLENDTVNFLSNIYGTKSHSGWLSFMYPRLKLARDLLSDDGVIFISIDDNEQANLKILCDEIFGSDNFIVNAIWEKVRIRKNSAKYFSESHEHILIYSKNKDNWNRNLLKRTDITNYKNPDNDPRGVWIPVPIHANHQYDADYKITKPNGVILERPKNNYWRLSEENFKKHVEENRIWWGNGSSYPMIKKFLSEVQQGLVPRSIFYYEDTGGGPQGDSRLKNLFDDTKLFENPKSTKLVNLLLEIATNKNDIVLDFFAGSGTTADAVMQLNAEDGGNRKFILVQIDEPIDESKPAYKFCTDNNFEPVISSITIERVNRAGEKILKEQESIFENTLDVGYKVFSLQGKRRVNPTNLLEIDNNTYSTDDKLYSLMCASSKKLTSNIECIEKDKLYKIDDSFYVLANFETSVDMLKGYRVYIDGYADISLESYLNMGVVDNDDVVVVY